MWGYFLLHHGTLWAPKYHIAESTATVLGNSSKKGRVELCVMKSHIRKQSLRKLLSSCYVSILLFSPRAPMGSQISLCSFHEKSVSKLLPEIYVVSLWGELTDQKEVSQKASFTFWTHEITFISVGLNAIQRSPSEFPQRQCWWTAPRNINLTLLDEFTHYQEVSKKASIYFSSEDSSFVTVRFIALWSI